MYLSFRNMRYDSTNLDRTVGVTTTVPVEVLLASGFKPLDLNNVFISDPHPERFISIAEKMGMPRNTCAWIKGILGVVIEEKIKKVIGVIWGDCNNTHALMEVLGTLGVEVIPFAYPYDHSRELLKNELEKLMKRFSVTTEMVEKTRKDLEELRKSVLEIDTGLASGEFENSREAFEIMLSMSDFSSSPENLLKRARELLNRKKCEKVGEMAGTPENKKNRRPRLGLAGVPPILTNLIEIVEKAGGEFRFFEIPRQFVMPSCYKSIEEQYLDYTYPYGMEFRLQDIKKQILERKLDGLIHYVQSFCFRQIEDIVLRKRISIPVLTLEADSPGPVDERTRVRIESFLEMLQDRIDR